MKRQFQSKLVKERNIANSARTSRLWSLTSQRAGTPDNSFADSITQAPLVVTAARKAAGAKQREK